MNPEAIKSWSVAVGYALGDLFLLVCIIGLILLVIQVIKHS